MSSELEIGICAISAVLAIFMVEMDVIIDSIIDSIMVWYHICANSVLQLLQDLTRKYYIQQ